MEMFGLGILRVLAIDAVQLISDDPKIWHPVCMVALRMRMGKQFNIRLEPIADQGSTNYAKFHQLDNCVVEQNGKVVPLKYVCEICGLPLPKAKKKGFNYRSLVRAIRAKGYNLVSIETDTIRKGSTKQM